MPLDPPEPGDLVGPFRVVRLLGAGGMGTVHEAVDDALDRRVALKVIAPARAADPAFRQRFVQEAQAQAALDSPHVVQVFAHGEADGRLYIASQLVPDGDLGALLRGGALAPERAVEVVAQVADGLTEAHRVGLVHRDIKPANVLLRNRGTDVVAYLADFGLAGRLGAGRADGAGTPGYLAPELERGAAAGVASDVYALGRLLRVAVCPDGGRLTRELERIVGTATAKNPVDRHPSAAAFRDDLRALLRTTPSRTPRRPTPAGAGVAAAVAIVVLALAATAHQALAERPADRGPDAPAITRLTDALVEEGRLDRASATCTARRLVETHGAAGVPGRVDERVLAAAADCLWRSGP